MSQVRIAVAGAGMIGRRHIEEVDASESAALASIVDPGPAGPELAEMYGVQLYASLADLFVDDKPNNIILATPDTRSPWRRVGLGALGIRHRREAHRQTSHRPPGAWRRKSKRYPCSPVTIATTARSWPRPVRSSKAVFWECLSTDLGHGLVL